MYRNKIIWYEECILSVHQAFSNRYSHFVVNLHEVPDMQVCVIVIGLLKSLCELGQTKRRLVKDETSGANRHTKPCVINLFMVDLIAN